MSDSAWCVGIDAGRVKDTAPEGVPEELHICQPLEARDGDGLP